MRYRYLRKISLALLLCSCCRLMAQDIAYPTAPALYDCDFIFGTRVEDPYRWLENVRQGDVKEWVNKQDSLAENYLDGIKEKSAIGLALRVIGGYTTDRPQRDGRYYFRLMSADELSTACLYIRANLHTDYDMLVDTRSFKDKDRIVIQDWSVSSNSKFLAYTFSKNGSDKLEVRVVKLPGGKKLSDHLENLANSSVAWKDSGFYYCRGKEQSAGEAGAFAVCYHLLNTPQAQDKIIFEKEGFSANRYGVQVTSDERYLVIEEYNIERFNYTVYLKDLGDSLAFIRPIIANVKEPFCVIDAVDSSLICLTNYPNLYNGAIVSINPADLQHWNTIIPHMEDLRIEYVLPLKDKILVLLQDTFIQRLAFFSYDGKLLNSQNIPFGYSCSNFSGANSNSVVFNMETYALPPSLHELDLKTYRQQIITRSGIRYDHEDFVMGQGLVKSKDSVDIPVFMVYHKDHPPGPESPVLLEAYGGFDISPRPAFNPEVVFFVEHGGVYVYANIRGGGFLAGNWHEAGIGLNKQKSYDDVIAVADFLISKQLGSPSKLALKGGSNGGLMVGAVITQRPALFKAAIAEAGLFDMMRYEQFAKGNSWRKEYGSVSDSVDFFNLLSYSPYHNIKQNTQYPALLIRAGEYDDRVSPMHSFKFAARLQAVTGNHNPVLLKVTKKAGHTGPKTWSDYEEVASGELAFLFHHLNMKW
jgi:prolyl oligopeptidase